MSFAKKFKGKEVKNMKKIFAISVAVMFVICTTVNKLR